MRFLLILALLAVPSTVLAQEFRHGCIDFIVPDRTYEAFYPSEAQRLERHMRLKLEQVGLTCPPKVADNPSVIPDSLVPALWFEAYVRVWVQEDSTFDATLIRVLGLFKSTIVGEMWRGQPVILRWVREYEEDDIPRVATDFVEALLADRATWPASIKLSPPTERR